MRYFFSIPLGQEGRVHNLAMIAHYDKPDHGLLKKSHNTYWTAAKLGDNGLLTVPVAEIESGVMMAPNEQIKKACPEKSNTDMWFLVERHGMKLTDASGMMSEEQVDTQEDNWE